MHDVIFSLSLPMQETQLYSYKIVIEKLHWIELNSITVRNHSFVQNVHGYNYENIMLSNLTIDVFTPLIIIFVMKLVTLI